jgi:CheY-like chemotaxis protein
MDISMPGMDGLEATRHLRAKGRNTETPIIGVTAHAGESDHHAALEAGMNECLIKPLRRKDLMSLLKMLTPSNWPTKRDGLSIDADVVAELCEILSADNVRRRMAQLAEETLTGLPDILVLATEGETNAARKLAHRLAGAASSFGALALAEQLRGLENAIGNSPLSEQQEMVEATRALSKSSIEALLEELPATTQLVQPSRF